MRKSNSAIIITSSDTVKKQEAETLMSLSIEEMKKNTLHHLDVS